MRVMGVHEWAVKGPMEQFPLLRLSPHEAIQTFCESLRDELDCQSAHGLDAQDLQRYYRNLFLEDRTLSPLGVYGYASRLVPVVLSLKEAKSVVKLLDAGCGYGTESLLFASLGADVTGVELVSERVRLARSRIGFYQNRLERAAGPLSVRFINADVIRYLEGAGPFDVIWAMEAISHIHPLELFLALAYRNLSPGGLLIISDPNGLNPIALYRAYRIRGTCRYTLRIKANDPDSGTAVYEAVERILPVPRLAWRLKDTGFAVRRVAMSGFLASFLVPPALRGDRLVFTLLTSLQRVLQALPILRLMGTAYTVVAQKGWERAT